MKLRLPRHTISGRRHAGILDAHRDRKVAEPGRRIPSDAFRVTGQANAHFSQTKNGLTLARQVQSTFKHLVICEKTGRFTLER